jgi:hypothetical protein
MESHNSSLKICTKCKVAQPLSQYQEKSALQPLQSWCKTCRGGVDRTNEYGRQKYGPKGRRCQICKWHRLLAVNGVCRGCNALHGLKECRVCGEILTINSNFYGGRAVCKICYRANGASGANNKC